MSRKSIIFAAVLVFCASAAFARTSTAVLTFSSSGYALSNGIEAYGADIVGVGFRSVTCPWDTGFYWAGDLTVGLPTTACYIDENCYTAYGESEDDLFVSMKIPLGWRFPNQGHALAFFIGAGAAGQMLVEWDDSIILYSAGPFIEFGLQSNRYDRLGLHLAFQLGVSPYVYSFSGDASGLAAAEASFRVGMSWRKKQG